MLPAIGVLLALFCFFFWLGFFVGKNFVTPISQTPTPMSEPIRWNRQLNGFGRGVVALSLLHAAVLDSRIRNVALEDMLVSYEAVVVNKVHRNLRETVVPGVLISPTSWRPSLRVRHRSSTPPIRSALCCLLRTCENGTPALQRPSTPSGRHSGFASADDRLNRSSRTVMRICSRSAGSRITTKEANETRFNCPNLG